MGVRLLLALALAISACGETASASPTPAPAPLPAVELKYRVMDAAGRIWFCDPDFYPIARADERDLAKQKIADIQKDTVTYAAIAARVGTDDLAVYRDWKALNALQLEPVNDVFGFAYLAQKSDSTGERVDGRVTAAGKVTVLTRTPAGRPNCPICLTAGTRIATPRGETAVQDLRVGDVIWTQDPHGARVAAPLIAIGQTPVPPTHQVVRLVLADGRAVLVSPGHPTADGRRVGDLHAGDALDGTSVTSTEREPYAGGFTYDVRPSGMSGAYWANGVLLGSTLP
jgi:Hint domain